MNHKNGTAFLRSPIHVFTFRTLRGIAEPRSRLIDWSVARIKRLLRQPFIWLSASFRSSVFLPGQAANSTNSITRRTACSTVDPAPTPPIIPTKAVARFRGETSLAAGSGGHAHSRGYSDASRSTEPDRPVRAPYLAAHERANQLRRPTLRKAVSEEREWFFRVGLVRVDPTKSIDFARSCVRYRWLCFDFLQQGARIRGFV